MDGWQDLNDVLREDTRLEAEWAAKNAPNTSKPPRGWRPTSWVDQEDAAYESGETSVERISRLSKKGYTPTAIASCVGLSESRVNQVLKVERERV